MYVVRRPFRNYGQVMLPGSIVEPGNIKRFKTRLNDHVIVEVPEKDIAAWDKYFVAKFGVSVIQAKEPVEEPTEEHIEEQIHANKPAASMQKPVKAILKT